MKNLHYLFIVLLLSACASSSQIFQDINKHLGLDEGGYTEAEAGEGIRQALIKGISEGVQEVGQLDGYFKNPQIKIPFPPEAVKIENTLRDIGLGNEVDKVTLTLNRAAEDAAIGAKDIFISAIKQLTFQDAVAIVTGEENAATEFLRRTTSDQLTERFKPVISNSLDKVNATKYWGDAFNTYNRIPLVQKLNPDLEGYVTQKAIDGLFVMVAKEEKAIRENPAERTTEILRKVFGG